MKSKIEELLRTYDKAVSEKINFDYAKCLKRSLTRHLRKSDYKKHLQNMNKNNPSVPIEDNDPIFQLIQQMRNGLVHMQKMEEKENFDGFYESRTKYPALFMIIDRLEFPEGADKTTSRNSYEELFNNYEAEKPWSKKIMNKIANNKSKNVSEWLITYYEAQAEITPE